MIKGLKDPIYRITLLRRQDAAEDMALQPGTHAYLVNPSSPNEERTLASPSSGTARPLEVIPPPNRKRSSVVPPEDFSIAVPKSSHSPVTSHAEMVDHSPTPEVKTAKLYKVSLQMQWKQSFVWGDCFLRSTYVYQRFYITVAKVFWATVILSCPSGYVLLCTMQIVFFVIQYL